MDALDGTTQVVTLALGLAGLAAAGYGLTRWLRPIWRRWRLDRRAERDALIGRPPVVDSITGKELVPALPGIGQRMANVEQVLVGIAESRQRLDDLESGFAILRGDVEALKAGAVERIVTRAESTQALRLMEKLAEGSPDDLPDLP